jgi:ABC-2 type transport system ATP-binding protein
MSAAGPLAIRAESLVRDFVDGQRRVRALDHLSLAVPMGSVFGFLGPNGAGKTTTIRTLLGLVEPTSGAAEVLGFDVRTQAARVRERSGALLEHAGLYERLTALENLEFYGRVWRMAAAERLSRARELLDRFGLWERRDEPVGRWSRGMKQKLAVARAVLHRPPLVFLDEPTAGLDPVSAAALRDDLATLSRGEGGTIFLTTHNLAEAERLCDLVGVIRAGRVLAVGAPATLRSGDTPRVEVVSRDPIDEHVLAFVRAMHGVRAVAATPRGAIIELAPDASFAPVLALLVREGVAVEEARRERPTLEDTFLALVRGDAPAAP